MKIHLPGLAQKNGSQARAYEKAQKKPAGLETKKGRSKEDEATLPPGQKEKATTLRRVGKRTRPGLRSDRFSLELSSSSVSLVSLIG